jgi:ribosomal protein L7/L12
MAELALLLSVIALVVAITALAVAGGAARTSPGPRPNVLTSLGQVGPDSEAGEPSPQVRALLQAGKKIEAIKQYRTETGAGLLEAKNAVEALERGQS